MVRGVDLLAQFDPFARIDLLAPRPLLMVIGSEAVTGHHSREAVERAAGQAELVTVDGATHMSLYDRDEHVTPAVARISTFLAEHLA